MRILLLLACLAFTSCANLTDDDIRRIAEIVNQARRPATK